MSYLQTDLLSLLFMHTFSLSLVNIQQGDRQRTETLYMESSF
jgi:hypothetical protein